MYLICEYYNLIFIFETYKKYNFIPKNLKLVLCQKYISNAYVLKYGSSPRNRFLILYLNNELILVVYIFCSPSTFVSTQPNLTKSKTSIETKKISEKNLAQLNP